MDSNSSMIHAKIVLPILKTLLSFYHSIVLPYSHSFRHAGFAEEDGLVSGRISATDSKSGVPSPLISKHIRIHSNKIKTIMIHSSVFVF